MNESAYRWEIDYLVPWCSQNNLELNALKTVEMGGDFRRNPAPPTPITLRASPVDTAESFRFLGTIISQDLPKRAQQRMHCGS